MTSAKPCCDIGETAGPRFFRALADPHRIAILSDLANCCGGSKTVGEVAANVPVDLSVVSRHLKTLLDAGILTAEKRGKTVRYTVRYTELVKLLRTLADSIEACCPEDGGTCSTADRSAAGSLNPKGDIA